MTNANTPTPRVDAFIEQFSGSSKALSDFARTLERELAECRAAVVIADIPTILAALREAAAELARLSAENERFRKYHEDTLKAHDAKVLALTAEVAALRAALHLIAVIDERRSPHLGPVRWSGIEKCCVPCIAAIALGKSGDTATAEDFDAARTNAL